ncbi:MAG: TonB-dependent receptor domain-containing protein [Terriglobia bacterium]
MKRLPSDPIMKKLFVAIMLNVALMAVLAIMASSARAQGTGSSANSQTRPSPAVIADLLAMRLNLSNDQEAQIKPIIEELAQKIEALRSKASMGPSEKKRKLDAIFLDGDKMINAILNDDQKKQYAEIEQKMRQRMALAAQQAHTGDRGEGIPKSEATPGSPFTQTEAQPQQAEGSIHGSVKSGTVPLPGVRVTAANIPTGRKYSAATDVNGGYRMALPQSGRYIVRAEFIAFATVAKEVLLNATSRDQQVDFTLTLASRAGEQEQGEKSAQNTAARRYSGVGAQNLRLLGSAVDLIGAAAGGGNPEAQLPSLAGNSDFSTESIAISGQSGTTNPLASVDIDQLRQKIQNAQADSSMSGAPAVAGSGMAGGGMGGGGGGGRMAAIIRNFKPNQPHGAFFWSGGNGALNAKDFPIRGQEISEPSYGSNLFGLTFFGAPYIPKIVENDTKDFLFFALSGQHSSQPFDQYGTVPTLDERGGNLSALATPSGSPIIVYDPNTGQPFQNNTILPARISPQATALLNYIPLPNLPGQFLNYQRLAAAETNSTKLGFRFMRDIGGNSGSPLLGLIQRYLGRGSKGQSINVNFNYANITADQLNLFPDLGGKEQIHQYSLQLGYTLGLGKSTHNFSANLNRTNSQLSNNFTNVANVASQIGLSGRPSNPLLYGLPSVTMDQFSSVSEQQPNFQVNQTIAFSDSSSWMHGKHNVHFGGDFRRVELNLLGETNSTGTYIFTGHFTQQPGTGGIAGSGSSLADLLLGLPQQTSLQAPYQKAYLRENAYDGFGQDDWRALPNLTFVVGLRYEYFSPFSENDDRLATLDTGNNFASVATVLPNGVGPYTGKYPRTLVYPERDDFSPRIGFAWNLRKQMVVRGGYGINFANGQYVTFMQNLAFQPPFADVQTNEATGTGPGITLADGFPLPQTEGNYAINKNYRLPYVQAWNLNLQRTVPWNVVLNIGYNGSKGTRLDIVDAPGRTATASLSGVFYDYEDSGAFSSYNALTASARKRLTNGISLQARYTYSHSIDDASSIGGNGGTAVVPAQNWQDLLAEKSNSSFDIRHQLTGNFLYELPFGPDTHRLTTGWLGHSLSGISISGTLNIASGEPLTPHYQATFADVARGSTGSLRPDRVPGVSLTAGGGSLLKWFNKDAFADPAGIYGSAARFSIPGPGTIGANASLSKTFRFSDTRSFEIRATANNVFNRVQYTTVDTTLGSASYDQVTGAAPMRQLAFTARFRY